MPLGALGLVLAAALYYSIWNLLLKTEPRRLQVQSGALAIGVLLASPVLFFYPLSAVSSDAWLLILLSACSRPLTSSRSRPPTGRAISRSSIRWLGERRRSW